MTGPSSCCGELQPALSLQLNPPPLHPGIKSLFDQVFIHVLKIVATEGCSESLRIIHTAPWPLRQDSHQPDSGWLLGPSPPPNTPTHTHTPQVLLLCQSHPEDRDLQRVGSPGQRSGAPVPGVGQEDGANQICGKGWHPCSVSPACSLPFAHRKED